MDCTQIIEIINGVGFPISMCLVLLWINHSNAKIHMELMRDLKESLDENTKSINMLTNSRK